MESAFQLAPLIVGGFVVGALVGLTGVGGGSLMTPLLISVMGVKPAIAVGTDLLFAALTKSGGIVAHGQKGNIDWRIVRGLALGSVPAALITLAAIAQLEDRDALVAWIRPLLGLALILTALAIVLREKLSRPIHVDALTQNVPPPASLRAMITLGFVLGALVSLTSVGAGALGVTALLILFPLLPTNRIVGSDIAHAVPLTLVAGIGHLALGHVDFRLLAGLLIGSLPGIWLGSNLTTRVPERIVRLLLVVILLIAAWKLLK